VGDYRVDLLVEGEILVELKAVNALHAIHEVQMVSYLTASRKDVGLLLNFGAERLEYKRKHRVFRSGRVRQGQDVASRRESSNGGGPV
jgi:hypothetical protein